MASAGQTIPLRFQRQELQQQADLSPEGLAVVAGAAGPREVLAALPAPEAAAALALMLPRRQAVWWACLCARLLPDVAARPADGAAIEAAETWVQTQSPEDAEQAGALAEACDAGAPARWAAMAAFWSGPSLAPRGQQAVAPAPHLAGVAARAALTLLVHHPAIARRIDHGDLLAIGTDLMHGGLGRQAQAAARERLAGPA
ncbi:DUF6931 family protein [Sphingomonas profundi]|uniref:DUF6931 family protein n=1 Tax=Alterirhizorhabdus profundi TaxID=2681549 RepID=UPI0012E893F5|nr:hypothetical protein [Sphingomonas profundi]